MHEITLVSPFPGGEERSASAGWGISFPFGEGGGKKVNQRQGWQAAKKAHPRRVLAWQAL